MLIIAKQYEEEIGEIGRLYNLAEQDIKAVGREKNRLIVAAVNQCRYAGQHLVRALAATDDESVREELAAANRHLRRAVYDSNDAAIQFYLIEIDAFRRRFPVNLNAIIPNYGKVTEAVTKAKRHIEDASQNNPGSRELLYAEIREDIDALRDAYSTLMASEQDCCSALRRENSKKLVSWVGVAITLVSAIALVSRLL
ncbi:MAG: hypothetical protein OXJ53_03420 [Gammaproteobacteria bacterium]|nr:hypothetical protein [Gammaproteobacteria bacterium]